MTPLQQKALRDAGLTTGGTNMDLSLIDLNDLPPPDEDPLAGLNEFIKSKIPQAAQDQARSSGGKYYPNIVRTMSSRSSGSGISSPRDPKAVVFPVRIADDASTGTDFLAEEGDIPSASKVYDSNYKKKGVQRGLKMWRQGIQAIP